MNFKCYNNNYWYERNEKFQGVNVSLGRYCNVDLSMEIKLCWLVFINLNFNFLLYLAMTFSATLKQKLLL